MSLEYDPHAAAAALAGADRRLAKVIRRAGPLALAPEPLQSPFEALLKAIVYQQLSGQAAATIHGRVAELFPRRKPRPDRLLALRDEALRGCGMSAAKVLAAKDLAAKTIAEVVPSLARLKRMDDQEIVDRLVQVRGIGRWSVEMLLIFRLGRADVLPIDDLGVRRGVQLVDALDDLPTPKQVAARGEPWRPYRSAASWYLWRAVEILGRNGR